MILTELDNNDRWTRRNQAVSLDGFGAHIYEPEDALAAFDLSCDRSDLLVYVRDGGRFWEVKNGKILDVVEEGFYNTMLELSDFLRGCEEDGLIKTGPR